MGKGKNVHKILLTLFVLMILFLSVRYLRDNACISIIGDEFGYWSAAAFILKKPWNSLAATNNYYGWGYGLVLAPILGLFSSMPSIMYRAAIFVNAIMLCLTLAVTYTCTLKILTTKNKNMAALISGTLTLFPSNIFAVYNTMPEIFIQLLYWIMIWIVLTVVEDKKVACSKAKTLGMLLLLILLAVYSFSVHQRTIGILAVVVTFCFLYILSTKKDILLNIGQVVLALVLFLLLIFVIKSHYTKWLYSGIVQNADQETALANDFSGVAHSLSSVFSWQGLGRVIISAIGKIYYSFTSSALFVAIGVFYCIKEILQNVKKTQVFFAFILLGWLQAVGIAALAMPGGFETRTDILIYGRYVEYALSPLIMVGLTSMCEKKVTYKQLFTIIVVHIVCSIVASKYIAASSINTNLGNIFTIAKAFLKFSNRDAICACSLIVIVILSVFLIFNRRKHANEVCLILLSFFEMYMIMSTYQSVTLPWQQQVNDNVNLNAVYHELRGEQNNLYVYEGGVGAKMMQFLNPNEECILVQEIEEIGKGDMFITQVSNKDYLVQISESYDIVYMNKILILLRRSE